MKKVIKFFQTYFSLSSYAGYDTRLRNGLVFGRPWSPLRFSGRFFPFWFGKYNYNNILLHAKNISNEKDIEISDNGTFNFTRYLEKKLLFKIVQMLKLPFKPFSGYITSGATEANMYAMWIAREWAKSKKLKDSKVYWIIPDNAHYSIEKSLELMDVRRNPDNEIIQIETNALGDAKYEKIVEFIKEHSSSPIILPLTVMTTECGAIDPVKQINDFIIQSKLDNIFFHVDAAFSGFILPFLNEYSSIFSLDSLTSISVDFSKTIGGNVGSGAVIFRAGLEEYVKIHASYLSTNADQTLTGSRKGSDVIAMYSILSVNSDFDIKKDILNAFKKTRFLVKEISKLNSIKLFYGPKLNYIVFSLNIESGTKGEKLRKILKSYAISSSMVKIEHKEQELFKIILRSDHSYKNIKKLINSLKTVS